MAQAETQTTPQPARRIALAAMFCVAGVALNLMGSAIAKALNCPMFLDSLGTVIAGALGGYVPGILVGYVTNLVCSIADTSMLYYGIVNVLVGIGAAFFAKRGWFSSIPKTLGIVVVLAFVGASVGTAVSWGISGLSLKLGEGASSPFAFAIYNTGMFDLPVAQLMANFAVELVDKAIIVFIAAVLVRVLPKTLFGEVDFGLWRQTPLTKDELAVARAHKPRSVSLRSKVVVLVSAIMIMVAVVTTIISAIMFNASMIEQQSKKGVGATNLMAACIDASRVDDYLSLGEAARGYREVVDSLVGIRDSFADVQYVYVYRILPDGCHVVFDPGAPGEPGSPVGDVVAFDEAFKPYLNDLLAGRPIAPIVSDESYGWLLTVYQPLKDKLGRTTCYVAVDISMDHLASDAYSFIARIIALFAGFFVLVCGLALWFAEYNVVLPVNTMAIASGGFAFDSEERRDFAIRQLRKLGIRTGDEIERLYEAIGKTAEDTMLFIEEAQERGETISRMQDNLILVLADLVESRDKFTGDHVRKTAAYTKVIMDQMREEGVYADELTDKFMEDVVHSAPLHDIGKIEVSDTILNKPGPLTDEEFEKVKTHTTVGMGIIENALGAVSESTYLLEAKNVAGYHHEKWNGQGYPLGLAGRDIPLSARIMAVADVFDVLVSKRSYKEALAIDEAFDVIREESGEHFDPQIVQAFLHAREEVSLVAQSQGDALAAVGLIGGDAAADAAVVASAASAAATESGGDKR